jgi:hypothetical protein
MKYNFFEVYIGRPSKWGNPFSIGPDGTRKEVIANYEHWLINESGLMPEIGELKGKVLGCWCSPKPCHGDVLVKYANKVNHANSETK